MSSKIKVDTIENVAGSGNVSLGSGHNLVVPGNITGQGTTTLTDDLTVDTDTLFVDASADKVGINNTSPQYPLQVNGSVDILNVKGSTGNAFVRFTDSDATADFSIGADDGSFAGSGSFILFDRTNSAYRLAVNSSGHVLKPNQPSFYVYKSGNQNNISNSGYDTITFDTEAFDIGGNFASNTFTAPVTGKYHLTLNVRLDNVDTAASYYNIGIVTSNRSHYQLFQPNHPSDVAYYIQTMTVVADMDANDTAACSIFQNGGTSQTDINVSTVFCGILIG